jgi:FtsH-binding integral membrane protein
MNTERSIPSSYGISERVTPFLRAVYGWMALGLVMTALVATFVAASPALVTTIVSNRCCSG